MNFNEPLCSPYWDQFKDKVCFCFFFGGPASPSPFSRGAQPKGPGDV